ncbi:hypothetical protein DFJ73DRAFT_816120 [Zopfochytrium polystomum]|nr:hypothetical protein DFJ73DRAFT_816120 [Zopfochytrium polystomum]
MTRRLHNNPSHLLLLLLTLLIAIAAILSTAPPAHAQQDPAASSSSSSSSSDSAAGPTSAADPASTTTTTSTTSSAAANPAPSTSSAASGSSSSSATATSSAPAATSTAGLMGNMTCDATAFDSCVSTYSNKLTACAGSLSCQCSLIYVLRDCRNSCPPRFNEVLQVLFQVPACSRSDAVSGRLGHGGVAVVAAIVVAAVLAWM